MKVEVTKITSTDLMDRAASFTVNKEVHPNPKRMYLSEHSPIRTQMFWVEMTDIPTFVSVHLVRHKFGVEHFVKSNREDRPGHTGDLGRMQPVNHAMFLNAQALIAMARKRLCRKTHAITRDVMKAICVGVAEVDPDLYPCLISECDYRGGVCHEFVPCVGTGNPGPTGAKGAGK